jgi:hypothetical protein
MKSTWWQMSPAVKLEVQSAFSQKGGREEKNPLYPLISALAFSHCPPVGFLSTRGFVNLTKNNIGS